MHGSSTSHSACVQAVSRPLPTRVINVRQDLLRLVEGHGVRANYCILSYRWGPPQHNFRMTSDNIDALRNGFQLGILPPLLQDAIQVTRQLGVDFVWIDSMCIIQGNEQGIHFRSILFAYSNNGYRLGC